MIVGSWTYSISNANAIKAYNTAAEYFSKRCETEATPKSTTTHLEKTTRT